MLNCDVSQSNQTGEVLRFLVVHEQHIKANELMPLGVRVITEFVIAKDVVDAVVGLGEAVLFDRFFVVGT